MMRCGVQSAIVAHCFCFSVFYFFLSYFVACCDSRHFIPHKYCRCMHAVVVVVVFLLFLLLVFCFVIRWCASDLMQYICKVGINTMFATCIQILSSLA